MESTDPDLARPDPPLTWRDALDRLLGLPPPASRLLAGGLLAVGAAVAAWALLRTPSAPPIEATLPYASAPAPATTSAPATDLLVHAAGAVVAPGVYHVPAGSRVGDVLTAAGGPAPDADLDAVNLAAPVADGDRVWFPRVGEAPPPPVAPAGHPGEGDEGLLDLNRATAAELEELPGIGPAIAAAIVERRERDGPFRSVDDLLDVAGIGEAKLAQIRDLVTV